MNNVIYRLGKHIAFARVSSRHLAEALLLYREERVYALLVGPITLTWEWRR